MSTPAPAPTPPPAAPAPAPAVTPSTGYNTLIEKIGRVVRDKGDVEIALMLDQILDKPTEPERLQALQAVVNIIRQKGASGAANGGRT